MGNALEILHSNLSEECNVILHELNKPKMKIVGIQNFEEMNNIELEDDINERNFSNYKKGCKILRTFINKKKGTQSALIEVTSEIYKHIRQNKNKIYVGHQKCIAYDSIDIKPCYNCGIFGHKSKKCRNSATCIKYAGKHSAVECVEKEKRRCTNCEYSNTRYQTTYAINHEVTDYDRCEIFKKRVRKYIEETDYSVEPVIPRDIGKVGHIFNNTTSEENKNKNHRASMYIAGHSSKSSEALNSLNEILNKGNI